MADGTAGADPRDAATEGAAASSSSSPAGAATAPPTPTGSGPAPSPAQAATTAAEADLTDARARQISLHDTTNRALAFLVTGMFAVVLLALIFCGSWIERGSRDILFTLLGVLGTGWANIIGFYFGSSAGSQQKSQAISAALTQKSGEPPA